jgi:hypothetical protein
MKKQNTKNELKLMKVFRREETKKRRVRPAACGPAPLIRS